MTYLSGTLTSTANFEYSGKDHEENEAEVFSEKETLFLCYFSVLHREENMVGSDTLCVCVLLLIVAQKALLSMDKPVRAAGLYKDFKKTQTFS